MNIAYGMGALARRAHGLAPRARARFVPWPRRPVDDYVLGDKGHPAVSALTSANQLR